MIRFAITPNHDADCVVAEDSRIGELYHVVRNSAGGATMTPIARYYVWKPQFIEGFHEHWRVDCFVRQHKLAPDPKTIGEALVQALKTQELCDEPIWLSCYDSKEVAGQAYGEVFDYD